MSIRDIREAVDQAHATDSAMVTMTVDEAEMLCTIAEKARGVIFTAHPVDIGKREVVKAWWRALVRATDDLEQS